MNAQRMRAMDFELRFHRQVLVEVTPLTRWEQPEIALKDDPTPTSGYALASASCFDTRRTDRAYVSDINTVDKWGKPKWRLLDSVYTSLEKAAEKLQV